MMNLMRPYLLATTVLALSHTAHGWVPDLTVVGSKLPTSALSYSSRSHENEADAAKNRKKMEMVRTLQASFYQTTTAHSEFDAQTGMIYNLPLWRVPWVEVPGRSNVLFVNQAMYTNMIEEILHAADPLQPFYMGHLYLPGGTKNLNHPDFKLQSWDQQVGGRDDASASAADRSAVVGTLLRISDYRRMADGGLVLLVQALERFVVKDVQQELPYSMAHVQLLPDTEEVEGSDWVAHRSEADVTKARAYALQESFERWHCYEYDNAKLPLPLESDLSMTDVAGSPLAKVLPYAPFSSVVRVDQMLDEPLLPASPADSMITPRQWEYSQNTLEHRLLQGGILQQSTEAPFLQDVSTDQLEIRVWLALNEFLKETRTPVSPVLFGLLPSIKWPRGFILERIGDFIAKQKDLDQRYVRVTASYPAQRRQKRLSYAVAALLEDSETVNHFRHELLEIPSTRERLALILRKLENQVGFQ